LREKDGKIVGREISFSAKWDFSRRKKAVRRISQKAEISIGQTLLLRSPIIIRGYNLEALSDKKFESSS